MTFDEVSFVVLRLRLTFPRRPETGPRRESCHCDKVLSYNE
jgi:hypothetical protein